jgi:alkanesulfonate monooxygenase SsuD/methylene tetrahydromethanopterin reductase-like flavin-dependent oxidoreductase (luciferase family)
MYRLRFDLRAPGCTAEQRARLYEAALEMSAFADERGGCQAVAVSEHHASDDGYLPSPLPLASAIAAVTRNVPIMVAAALLPLYDPVRMAEDMIVLDHLSRGRVIHILGIGYRPVEYELHGVDYHRRGAIADEKLEALLHHLRSAGEGSGARITPAPFTPGGPMVVWGGTSKKAAARAGRNGLGFIAQSGDPALGPAYEGAARAAGHEPGLCMLPSPDSPASVFVADDVDDGWSEVGPALLADASVYWAWNEAAGLAGGTVSLTKGSTVEELRAANGSHRVVTVDEAVALIRRDGALGLQPLCGGLDPDIAWPYLRRVVDEVVPRAAAS